MAIVLRAARTITRVRVGFMANVPFDLRVPIGEVIGHASMLPPIGGFFHRR
jgi:hypothetical protein